MGFYIELNPVGDSGQEFRETEIPPVFWMLYLIAGFALLCMGLAAHTLLKDLARIGSGWDLAIVYAIISAVPFYFLIGFKLGALRRFVRFTDGTLAVGYQIGKTPFRERKIAKKQIQEILLVNLRPSPNLAPQRHLDAQYYIRGHWRVVALLKNGKRIALDRHTEKGALEPLYKNLCTWLG